MKKIIITIVVLILTTGLVFARLLSIDVKQPPRLALPDAYVCATSALGIATNQFHCIRASILVSQSPDGEWLFSFCNKNGAYKSVTVFYDKQTKVKDGSSCFY